MAAASNSTRGITRELARYAVRSRYAELPQTVKSEAARALVNWIGCALGGCTDGSSRIAEATAARWGGAPQASVLGHRQKMDIGSAAFVNCVSSSCFAFDDAHLPTVAHPSSPAGAALLAFSELYPTNGEKFLNAFALAIEVQCRLSSALVLPPSRFNAGFYVSGLTAPIGVALGIGNLMQLDEQKMATAIALAASQACGFRSTNGTMSANFRSAHSARCGMLAAMLAADGFTSDDDALEARHGYFSVFAAEADFDRVVEGLGSRHELFDNAYKPYPCGVVIHPALDACLDIAQRAPKNSRLISAKLSVHPSTIRLCSLRSPATPRESAVSLYHWASAALIHRKAGLAQAQSDCIHDPEVAALRAVIEAQADPTLGHEQAIAEVTFADGQKLHSHILNVRGSRTRPMTDSELDAKFTGQAEPLLGSERTESLLRACRGAHLLDDVGMRISALATP